MIEQYKHKKLGWIARKNRVDGLHLDIGNQTFLIPKELIEDSQDRELIEEKDWIDDVLKYLWNVNGWELFQEEKDNLKSAINKYMPKISEYELDKCELRHENIVSLIKSKGLLK